MKRPILAVSIGCPAGVGPEVAVLGAAKTDGARCVLVGDPAIIERAAVLRRVSKKKLVPVGDAAEARRLKRGDIGVFSASTRLGAPTPFGVPDANAGAAQLAWIDEATKLVTDGIAAALVTGPVSKLAIATSGAPGAERFRGHTEHLAERLGAAEVVMAFSSRELTTALVTTHLALADVPAAITKEAVATTTYWVVRLIAALGERVPRVAVAALNPHAGEGGLLGDEETTRIEPGVALACARLDAEHREAEVRGPIGAETALRLAAAGEHDAVVCMYHDQATIPSKLLGFGEAVNVTLGLPIVRTSVDHGTAYDAAGTGKADARGMREALALAVRLARAKLTT
jgi:4-hydroxythreonine-4-phosphate dehydrogenase